MDLQKLPAFLENRDKSNYAVRLDPQAESAQTSLQFNLSYVADPEIAKWLNNKDFPARAVAGYRPRPDQRGVLPGHRARPARWRRADDAPDSPGPEWRTKWSTYDPPSSRMTCSTRSGSTRRTPTATGCGRTAQGRLRIEITTVAAAFLPWAQQMEMVTQQWKQIGIQADVKDTERNLAVHDESEQSDPDLRVGRGHRGPVPVSPARAAGRTGRAVHRPAVRQVVCIERRITAPSRPIPDLLKAMDLLRSGAGLEEGPRMEVGKQIRAADRRQPMGHRHGRLRAERAHHQQQDGQCARAYLLALALSHAGRHPSVDVLLQGVISNSGVGLPRRWASRW